MRKSRIGIFKVLLPLGDAQFMWLILALSAVFHVFAAFLSQGFHSADEYFQILEFAAFKLGMTPQAVLAVEYGERMRPWLLPGFVTWVVRGLQTLGLNNPHHWAVALRLVSGAVGWGATVAISLCAPSFFKSPLLRRIVWIMAGFLWFVPALHVRPSSEAWSGSWIVIGWALVWWELARRERPRFLLALVAGACAGLAFETRFQAGVMIAPFGLALGAQLWRRGAAKRVEGLQFFSGLILGFSILFIIGRIIDVWGYGAWCFSPWNYVHFNLIRDEVNKFGVSPFWDVFRMANTEAWPILGFLLVVSWCVAWVRSPRSLLTAVTAPLFIVHCLISHKELRFFFPIASFSPLLVGVALQGWSERLRARRSIQAVASVLLIWNGIGFVSSSLQPISRNVLFFRAIWDLGVKEIATLDQDPFDVLGTATFFYRPAGLIAQPLLTREDLTRWVGVGKNPISNARYVFRAGAQLPQWVEESSEIRCDRVFQTLPETLSQPFFRSLLQRANTWTLWSCYRIFI